MTEHTKTFRDIKGCVDAWLSQHDTVSDVLRIQWHRVVAEFGAHSAAANGVLRALVGEAWGAEIFIAYTKHFVRVRTYYRRPDGGETQPGDPHMEFVAPSEGEALAAALHSAPEKR